MKLYYHKTSGGAEYLMDTFVKCENGHKEGIFEGAKFIVRIDGDIEKDAELSVGNKELWLLNQADEKKCGGCCELTTEFYGLGETVEDALKQFEDGEDDKDKYGVGLCAHCMCEVMAKNVGENQ